MIKQLPLTSHLFLFLKTRESNAIFLWFVLLYLNWHNPALTIAGFLIGILAYTFFEEDMHRWMHTLKHSPFHKSHIRHHDHPSPETGVPDWWVFISYYCITFVMYYFQLKVMLSIWFGILTMLIAYEWVHYLCHCNYKPKTRIGWSIRVNHLLHHKHDSTTRYEMIFLKPKR